MDTLSLTKNLSLYVASWWGNNWSAHITVYYRLPRNNVDHMYNKNIVS